MDGLYKALIPVSDTKFKKGVPCLSAFGKLQKKGNVYYIDGNLLGETPTGTYVINYKIDIMRTVDITQTCKYTGMFDIGGRMIFEKDYIGCIESGGRVNMSSIYYVERCNGNMAILNKGGVFSSLTMELIEKENLSVVGDDFRSPELGIVRGDTNFREFLE